MKDYEDDAGAGPSGRDDYNTFSVATEYYIYLHGFQNQDPAPHHVSLNASYVTRKE